MPCSRSLVRTAEIFEREMWQSLWDRYDRILGLNLGADDYIVKPFEADILVLRLQNILKRTRRAPRIEGRTIASHSIGRYEFDAQNHTLSIGETSQSLTEKEALLISFFYENKNQMLRREDILTKIWGNDDFFSGLIPYEISTFNTQPKFSIDVSQSENSLGLFVRPEIEILFHRRGADCVASFAMIALTNLGDLLGIKTLVPFQGTSVFAENNSIIRETIPAAERNILSNFF